MKSISIMSYFASLAVLVMGVLGAVDIIEFNVVGAIVMYLLLKELAELFMAQSQVFIEEE
jgi:uncharacterized membrane protein (DUF4010 family)